MSDFLNPIAEKDSPDSGILVPPELAASQKFGHKFYCPDFDCKDPKRILIVKRSKLGKYFFSHKAGFGHDIGPETLLHKSAIKWFIGKPEYEIPEILQLPRQTMNLDVTKTQCEFRRLKRFIPDVRLMTVDGFEFAIEIVVTSDISESKSKLIQEFGLPTLRVVLSDFYNANKVKCRIDLDFINENLPRLLTDFHRKNWAPSTIKLQEEIPPSLNAVIPEEQIKPKSGTPNDGCAAILVFGWILVAALLIALNF